VIGLPEGVPLLVYSGAVSRARGLDVLVEALVQPEVAGVHAVVVPVPHPHPLLPQLQARAETLGVGDRFHVAPPVDADDLPHYLSGADVAVMPFRTGSANIEAALPNKLFENLHAGLTMVTCDAALIAAFVREHDLGEVFSFAPPGAPPGTPGDAPAAADLARAVRRALDHPRTPDDPHRQELRRRYSWQGQEVVLRELYAALVTPPTPDGIDATSFGSLLVRTHGRSS
jgi:glycosyltransferase involved in cell wall biosynthesis